MDIVESTPNLCPDDFGPYIRVQDLGFGISAWLWG